MTTESGSLFVDSKFLDTLQTTHCTGPGTGWQRVSGLDAPAYLKTHSHGEFVFDWMWAQAAHQAGFRWFPKLLLAAPFTPVTGPRLSLQDRNKSSMTHTLGAVESFCDDSGISVSSINFCNPNDRAVLEESDWLHRFDWQFHWRNNDYNSFDDFLTRLRRKPRKNIITERRKTAEAGWHCEWHDGDSVDDSILALAYHCYQSTHQLYGNHTALSEDFFYQIARVMGPQFLICTADQGDQPLAAGIFFRDNLTLYGRYWGSLLETRDLHFEVCYYQGIEYCIQHGLLSFEPGAQGEHKIKRGFLPTQTHSFHRITVPPLRQGIARYLEQESKALMQYREDLESLNPYQRLSETE